MILSETAGAAKELLEAIIINSNCVDETSDALKVALQMPLSEQIDRMTKMQSRLKKYDVVRWGNDFINDLLTYHDEKINKKLQDDKVINSKLRMPDSKLINFSKVMSDGIRNKIAL